MGLTEDIGAFIAALRFADLPPAAIRVVRTGFTDCVAVMIAGAREPVSRIIATERGLARTGARGILIGETKGPAPDLALLYGAAAHALDYDDTAFVSHPSAVLVPAILAEASETPATGADLAAAYVAGYEVWAELILRDADPHHLSGWHPTGAFGTLGAAAAVAKLRRQDGATARTTIAIAASLSGGVTANFGSMTKPFHAGRAAQAGLQAARWSEAGLTASPDAIEHPLGFLRAVSHRGKVETDAPAAFGRTWHILEHGVNVKLYPMCYGTHCILDGMLDLKRAHGFAADAIAAVDLGLAASTIGILRNHRPRTPLEAKFSAEFAMAAAAIRDRCTGAELDESFIGQPDVQGFFGKVRISEIADDAAPRVNVSLADGRTFATEVFYPRGHFKQPADRAALWAKFSNCTENALDPAQARAMFDALQRIDQLSGLAELLPPPVLQETG